MVSFSVLEGNALKLPPGEDDALWEGAPARELPLRASWLPLADLRNPGLPGEMGLAVVDNEALESGRSIPLPPGVLGLAGLKGSTGVAPRPNGLKGLFGLFGEEPPEESRWWCLWTCALAALWASDGME